MRSRAIWAGSLAVALGGACLLLAAEYRIARGEDASSLCDLIRRTEKRVEQLQKARQERATTSRTNQA
jgi:hypothetical protein